MDERKYDGWIVSDSFLKRMLAILGYSILGQLFIYAVLLIFFLVFGMMAAMIGVFI